MAESRLDDFIKLFQEKRIRHVKDIENELGISRQSVYRLRDQLYTKKGIALEASIRGDDGTLLENEELGKGYLKWPEATEFEEDVSFVLSKAQLEALKTAVAQTKHITPLLQGALDALGKNNLVRKQIKSEPIIYNPQIDQYDKDIFEKISKAILNNRIVIITYENAKGEEKTYKFNAYKIISSDNHLHLVGVSHNSIEAGYNTIIRLRLDKIKDFQFFFSKEEKVRFDDPKFDAKAYSHREFGPFSAEGDPLSIKVLFSKEKALYIERTKRHPSQQVSIQKDGTALWQIEAPISQDLVYWIVSYGPHARVLEPEELREQVIQWARGSLDANS